MKKKLIPIVTGLSAATLLSGCVFAIGLGSGDKKNSTTNNNDSHATTNTSSNPAVVQQTVAPTIGQQLLDLKKAFDAGAISAQEYQTEKAKILAEKQ
ncbi:MAG TPA: SHOCT domain-containing protein [Candidatus Sulfotelmatobacter sp.]|nr:SHOCT domain-containing protein [Candidatus Sulfotelmatobacter sp.]